MKTCLYTLLALLAFAGNSVLCRLALGENAIDAAGFTVIRLLSGITVLAVVLKVIQASSEKAAAVASKGSWKGSFMLFLYAITFSFSYLSLETGIGALILFGAVQITMILADLIRGNTLHKLEWAGVIIAFLGFVYLVAPTLGTPSLTGFILMAIAGIAWGFYTLFGRGSENPLGDTTYNFLRTLPFVIILVAITWDDSSMSQKGIVLAVLSGGVTSGLGYTIWYMSLRGLSSTQASVVQLLVPVIAAFGGIVFAQEFLSLRLMVSSAVILGGVLMVVLGKHYYSAQIR